MDTAEKTRAEVDPFRKQSSRVLRGECSAPHPTVSTPQARRRSSAIERRTSARRRTTGSLSVRVGARSFPNPNGARAAAIRRRKATSNSRSRYVAAANPLVNAGRVALDGTMKTKLLLVLLFVGLATSGFAQGNL